MNLNLSSFLISRAFLNSCLLLGVRLSWIKIFPSLCLPRLMSPVVKFFSFDLDLYNLSRMFLFVNFTIMAAVAARLVTVAEVSGLVDDGIPIQWLTEISESSISTSSIEPTDLIILSVSSPRAVGIPLISRHSRLEYCSCSSIAVLS